MHLFTEESFLDQDGFVAPEKCPAAVCNFRDIHVTFPSPVHRNVNHCPSVLMGHH